MTVGGQYAAQQQARRAAGAGHRRVDAKRPVAFPAFGEVGGDQRQRGRRDHRAADALHRPGGKQPRLARGEAAEQRRGRKQQQPEHEHPPPAKDVTGAAAEQEQAAEGDRVGVHHPLQSAAGEAKCLLDVREGNVHDGRVEHDHELGGGDDQQSQAEAAVAAGRGCGCGRMPGLGLRRPGGGRVVGQVGGAARAGGWRGHGISLESQLSRRVQACRQPCERPSPDPGDSPHRDNAAGWDRFARR